MRVAIFSAHHYEEPFFQKANEQTHYDLVWINKTLSQDTVVEANGCSVVVSFITDKLNADNIEQLAAQGVKLIALRSAGYDHVDLAAAAEHQITVVNAPTYSPSAVAEHAILLMLACMRHFVQCQQQIADNNFTLENILGDGVKGKTVGIIGTGNIGTVFAHIAHGFGCDLLGYDVATSEECVELGMQYVTLEELLSNSDIISLHCPLNDKTHHLINAQRIAQMKSGVILINTSRGAVVDTQAVIAGLDSAQISHYGMDVYEKEKGLFFVDHHGQKIDDALFEQLRSHAQVVITPHSAFFTADALQNIAITTIDNIKMFIEGKVQNQVRI